MTVIKVIIKFQFERLMKSLTSSIFLTFWEFLSDIEAAMQALIC